MCDISVTLFLSVAGFMVVLIGVGFIVHCNLDCLIRELRDAGIKTKRFEEELQFWDRLTKSAVVLFGCWLVIYLLAN